MFAAPAASAQGACPDGQSPPPPMDTSERPAPGQAAPAPLPVPTEPVGGTRMGECGLVVPAGSPAPPDTTAVSWVIQDLDTGAVVAAKNPHARERPASLIKTLLALVAIKDLQPDQVVVATPEDAGQECTCVGLVAGGSYTVDQLLHGLLMHSGNDVAHALATALGGVPEAVRKMNDLAASLGATDTRTATPSGLDGPGMSSSAYDLSLIFHAAMKEKEFATVVATRAFQFPAQPVKPAFSIVNDNRLLGAYPGFLGGKTGFTDDARHTYVGGAEQGGTRLAVVMTRAEQRPIPVVNQAGKLLDYGFALEKTAAQPVGTLLQPSTSTATNDAVGSSQVVAGKANAGGAAKAAGSDPFGLTGWLVTLVVAVLIVIGFVIGISRKKDSTPPQP
ncbi:MAG TPA: serine hydrolase [Amycolatopsis sp.]|nr:serine hydrolase [Amycolatopsis sp.]HKS49503.1 serine hydrolase [Amycolatopsis sp.]